MTDSQTLSRVVSSNIDSSDVFEVLEVDSIHDIVVADVKNPNGGITPSQYAILCADPFQWRDEIIKIMQVTEQSLSSVNTRISVLATHVSLADGDWNYTAEIASPHGRYNNNAETKDLAEIVDELATCRHKRMNSVRFMHALETKLVEVKALIRSVA